MSLLPFTFGIPLIARASTENWALVEALLDMTLMSIRAQTHGGAHVVIAGHDRPCLAADFVFLQAEWDAERVRSDNRDSGRKKHAIARHVLHEGGGLLMFLDADDWVDVRLVERARATIGPHDIGGLISTGIATDLQALRSVAIPHPAVFDRGFHEICGSSTVACLRPDDPDPLRRDPTATLHEHYRWREVTRDLGVSIAALDVMGHYVVNTSANHSEAHGPFAEWRRAFSADVRRCGIDATDASLARFGLDLATARGVRDRFFRPP